ncbi:MAG: site-specific DNA endonuclease [Candidatus Berkelbacteria bacterium Athens1014_28]|uniref:Site-specific DNA endonuclease n=1 Tax=Candidatus Berkelbacteria bacterium Athens1014_28 TaxID=2017145 RepID=A0A554LPD2_9BACT|nr:MAG: site-specific DNA endonuclease [Candidatus Berkelbacteria bacterium Athens1014_28]
MNKDNTVGSRSKNDFAYIAGFLDGDGSLMLQIKRRKDTKQGFRVMSTICFYQKSAHKESLVWIKNILQSGYLSDRNDGITELRINGYKKVVEIIDKLSPFIRFKKIQANALHKASKLLSKKSFRHFSIEDKCLLMSAILAIQNNNYQSACKKSKKELIKILDLTP